MYHPPMFSHTHKIRRASSTAVVAVAALALASCSTLGSDGAETDDGDRWPTTISLGPSPAEASRSVAENSATLIAILEDELGLETIEFESSDDYGDLINGVVDGSIDAAQFAGFPYVLATDSGADVTLAGSIVYDRADGPGYRSYAVVPAGSEVSSLEDSADLDVCFVDPDSTSGYLFPSAGLIEAGVDPETDVVPVFAGGHDASVEALLSGSCELAFVYDTMLTDVMMEAGTITGIVDEVDAGAPDDETIETAEADVNIVWKSDVIPRPGIVVSNELPTEFVEAFGDVVTTKLNARWAIDNGYCDGTQDDNDCAFGTGENPWGYVATDDSFYDGIRNVCATVGSDDCDS